MILGSHTLPYFVEYADLLIQLHQLIRENRDNDDADAIRDKMDEPWRHLSSYEIAMIRGLSSDLHSLRNSDKHNGHVSAQTASMIAECARRGDFQKMLHILRENESALPADYVAHWRGVGWADMGFLSIARAFFQRALQISPTSPFHLYMLMRLLIELRDVELLLPLAQKATAYESDAMLLYAASIAFMLEATRQEPHLREAEYRKVIETVEKANQALKTTPELRTACDAVIANIYRSLCYDQLDRADEAIRSCEFALKIDPNNRHALQVRAVLTRGSNPDASRQDTLIGFGTPAIPASVFEHVDFSAYSPRLFTATN